MATVLLSTQFVRLIGPERLTALVAKREIAHQRNPLTGGDLYYLLIEKEPPEAGDASAAVQATIKDLQEWDGLRRTVKGALPAPPEPIVLECSEHVADMLDRYTAGEPGIGLGVVLDHVMQSGLSVEIKQKVKLQAASGAIYPNDFREKHTKEQLLSRALDTEGGYKKVGQVIGEHIGERLQDPSTLCPHCGRQHQGIEDVEDCEFFRHMEVVVGEHGWLRPVVVTIPTEPGEPEKLLVFRNPRAAALEALGTDLAGVTFQVCDPETIEGKDHTDITQLQAVLERLGNTASHRPAKILQLEQAVKTYDGLHTGAETVWENECQLVWNRVDCCPTGEMGLCYLDTDPPGEVQVAVRLKDAPELLARLQDVPVRVVISRVPGGNV